MVNITVFKIPEKIGNFISSNVQDIKKDRKNKRWVFPQFPETDSNYPEAVIDIGEPEFLNTGAGDNYSHSEILVNGDYKSYYARELVTTVHIYVLTSKREEYEVVKDGEQLYLSNKPANIFLSNEIKDVITANRNEFVQASEGFEDIEISNMSPVYENNKNSWATDITLNVKILDYWVKEYSDGALIASYNLSETVTQV